MFSIDVFGTSQQMKKKYHRGETISLKEELNEC